MPDEQEVYEQWAEKQRAKGRPITSLAGFEPIGNIADDLTFEKPAGYDEPIPTRQNVTISMGNVKEWTLPGRLKMAGVIRTGTVTFHADSDFVDFVSNDGLWKASLRKDVVVWSDE